MSDGMLVMALGSSAIIVLSLLLRDFLRRKESNDEDDALELNKGKCWNCNTYSPEAIKETDEYWYAFTCPHCKKSTRIHLSTRLHLKSGKG